MVRYGIPLLDELRAVHQALLVLQPFDGMSPQTSLIILTLREREKQLRENPALHEVLGDMYGYPCANLEEKPGRNKQTREERMVLTCGQESCSFFGQALDPDKPVPDCEGYRVPAQDLDVLLAR